MQIDKLVEINELLRIYGGLLTKRQFSVLTRRYTDDLSLGEIAEQDNISRQGVLNFEKKALVALYKFEKKVGFWEYQKHHEKVMKNISLEYISRVSKDGGVV